MSADNIALIKGLYDAFAKGDIADALGRMSPDMVWNEAENFPYADRNPYHGPEAVVAGVFARIGAEWENFSTGMGEALIGGGDQVVSLGRYQGTYKATGGVMS